MTNVNKNAAINARLKIEYDKATTEFLEEWEKAFKKSSPCRMNEFGIIDINEYDTDQGILFIGRETNGWSDDDYANGCLFKEWMYGITKNGVAGKGHIQKHPNMWYNIGRWTMLIQDPTLPIEEIATLKETALRNIKKIAFTNINKVRGKDKSEKEYYTLIKSMVARDLLKKEIEIINPKVIVCCGTAYPVCELIPKFNGKIILMPHPGARKNTQLMLSDLKAQLDD